MIGIGQMQFKFEYRDARGTGETRGIRAGNIDLKFISKP